MASELAQMLKTHLKKITHQTNLIIEKEKGLRPAALHSNMSTLRDYLDRLAHELSKEMDVIELQAPSPVKP